MSKHRPRAGKIKRTDPFQGMTEEEIPRSITVRLTTPPDIDKYVAQFCKEISPNETPIFLQVQPPDWSRLNYCNKNVAKMMELNGGGMVLGYKIWYVPDLYIEAESHAVWLNPIGQLVDITFNKDRENRILFLPSRKLKTVVSQAVTKPRKAFDPRVQDFVRAQIEYERHLSQFSVHDNTWDGWERAKSFQDQRQDKAQK